MNCHYQDACYDIDGGQILGACLVGYFKYTTEIQPTHYLISLHHFTEFTI
jgi:hypothetical protein